MDDDWGYPRHSFTYSSGHLFVINWLFHVISMGIYKWGDFIVKEPSRSGIGTIEFYILERNLYTQWGSFILSMGKGSVERRQEHCGAVKTSDI